jgi:IS5 family transposase
MRAGTIVGRDDHRGAEFDEERRQDPRPRDAPDQEGSSSGVCHEHRRQTCGAVLKMGVGLPKPACRGRLQTTRCCCVQKARW